MAKFVGTKKLQFFNSNNIHRAVFLGFCVFIIFPIFCFNNKIFTFLAAFTQVTFTVFFGHNPLTRSGFYAGIATDAFMS